MIRTPLDHGRQIQVELTNAEATTAGVVAVAYGFYMLKHGGQPNRDFRGNFWDVTRQGLIAEYAVALGLGVPWDPPDPGTFQIGDVAGFYQVKSTPHIHGCLMLDVKNIRVDVPYVLVTGAMPVYILRGWIWGGLSIGPLYYWKPRADRPGQYFIPQGDLNPMDVIPRPGYPVERRNA